MPDLLLPELAWRLLPPSLRGWGGTTGEAGASCTGTVGEPLARGVPILPEYASRTDPTLSLLTENEGAEAAPPPMLLAFPWMIRTEVCSFWIN